MAIRNSLATTTPLTDETLATYIFAMGDSRFYSRMKFPKQVFDAATGVLRDTKLSDIIAVGVAMEAETESILLSVNMSIKYEDDEAAIPDGDKGFEYSHYILIRSDKDPVNNKTETWQLRIPNLPKNFDTDAWVTANANLLFSPSLGVKAKKEVAANKKEDRRARSST